MLIDCGEGTQIQLQKAGLGLGKCTTVLITHLHGDHYFGLPGLLSSLALSGRTAPLRVVSPLHLRPRINALFELDRYPMPYEVTFDTHEATGLSHLFDVNDLEIHAFPLQHRTPTNGYLIRERKRPPNIIKEQLKTHAIPWQEINGIKSGADFQRADGKIIPNAELLKPGLPSRSFAYCSDTVYFPELSAYVRGVDLLYHEATFLHDMLEDATKKGHSTAKQAAQIAAEAGAGQLVLGHFSSRYPDVTQHEVEARATFPRAYAARDLCQYAVPLPDRGDHRAR